MESIKLTLSIPKRVLADAKAYSRLTHQPLSQLVSRYFSLLTAAKAPKGKGGRVSRKVQELTGIAKTSKSTKAILLESLLEKYTK